eukprot:scaffold31704_cov72-Cyclotella_meneghiniana.AAC.10
MILCCKEPPELVEVDNSVHIPKDEPKVALHMERGLADSTTTTSISDASSNFDDFNIPITGVYSDINLDYIISSKILGSGRFGVVRECTHRKTGLNFAVKCVEKFKVGRLDYLQREVLMLSKMDHKHIIRMVDCYEDAQSVYIVTPQYHGGELYDKIIRNYSQDGCLSEHVAAEIIKQLLEAVSYLHKNSCVHRDLKPENIMIESSTSSSIRIIDFGLACHHSQDDPNLTSRVGSEYYMAPELHSCSYNCSVDIWSVGVITYILLCGYSPFHGDEDHNVVQAIQNCEYSFIHGWDSISDTALDFIQCLLKKDPRERLTADEALMHPWLKDVGISG